MNYFTALVVRQPDSRPGWAVLDEDGGTAAAAYSSRLLGFNTVAADTLGNRCTESLVGLRLDTNHRN